MIFDLYLIFYLHLCVALSTMRADLESGVANSFPFGLLFERKASLSGAVAAAAEASQVCYESSVRGLLYHLPNLLHHVSLRLQPSRERLQRHDRVRGSVPRRRTRSSQAKEENAEHGTEEGS